MHLATSGLCPKGASSQSSSVLAGETLLRCIQQPFARLHTVLCRTHTNIDAVMARESAFWCAEHQSEPSAACALPVLGLPGVQTPQTAADDLRRLCAPVLARAVDRRQRLHVIGHTSELIRVHTHLSKSIGRSRRHSTKASYSGVPKVLVTTSLSSATSLMRDSIMTSLLGSLMLPLTAA